MRSQRAIAVAGVAALAVLAVALRGACGAAGGDVAYAARPRSVERDERAPLVDAPRDEPLREPASVEGATPEEALERAAAAARSAAPDADQIARWIEDLRDDTLAGNATRALYELGRVPVQAFEPLCAVVESQDEQQRKLALYLLSVQPRSTQVAWAAERYVAELAPDDLPLPRTPPSWLAPGGRCFTSASNASAAASWLHRNCDQARNALEMAWSRRTGERAKVQEELAVAALLALDGASKFSFAARELLTEHMRDNDIAQDAALAFDVLYDLGPLAIPHIDRAWPGADAQQREYLSRLLADRAPSDPRGANGADGGPVGMARPAAIHSLTERWLFAE